MGISEVMYAYGLSVFSIALIFLITYLQIKINISELRQWCILVLACSLVTNISIMFQIVNISNISSNIWYEAFSIIGISMLPVCCFFAVCYYLNEDFVFTNKHIIIFIIPIISVFATFTNDMHHLMFKQFSTSVMQREFGILYYFMIVDIIIKTIMVVFIILKHLAKNVKKYKTQLILSFAFMVIPAVILILGNLKLLDVKIYFNGIFLSMISIITIEILFRYQILTVIPISLINVLNTITDGFIVINKDGKIVSYNKTFINIFDLGKLKIKKMNIKELLDFKEFDTLSEEDIKKITSISKYSDIITFERNSDKLKLTLKYECSKLDKKVSNLFVITVVDITGYSRDIRSIERNREAILGRERLASLGQMIGGIAHNLKTPIFSIAGAIEGIEDLVVEYKESISDENVTIQDHKEIAKDMFNWTEKIQGYLSYMTDIITAIQMQTSAEYSNETDSFSIKELLKYINILMKYELSQNLIKLEINIKIDENTLIYGNINSLIQVLNNLISNSIQAYSKKEDNKRIILDIYENKNNIYIEITDFAGGIPEEIKNKLFKEMVTTKGKNGTGLGLFISYTSIKTGFGGNLCFTTKQGEGTTFRIIIPLKKNKKLIEN